jgi:soluble lytic murein transglycosylase-like protein
VARLGPAAVLLAAALSVPARLGEGPRRFGPAEPERGASLAAGCPEAVREAFVARMEDRLYERMPASPQVLHEQVARALVGESEEVKVDPLLVLAMIEVESGFDSTAVSSAGAHGLMQLLPGTMQREAEALGLDDADPADPVANVRAGVRYLRRCLDAYPGHLDLALMAYNSGPNRVLEFLEDGEVPEWASAYPLRVEQALGRVRRAFAAEPSARLAEAGPGAGRAR